MMSSGEVWMGIGHTLSEYRDGEWVEHSPLDGFLGRARGRGAADDISAGIMDLGIGTNDTLWAFVRSRSESMGRSFVGLVRRDDDGWSTYPLDEIVPNALPYAWNILVDDDGAVLMLVRDRPRGSAPDADGARLIRFDGRNTTELARLPSQLGYRLVDIGPDGTIWLVGGGPKGTIGHRLHIVSPQAGSTQE